MKEPTHCEDCGYALKWDLLTGGHHDRDLCLGRQFVQVKAENKRLKESVKSWMNAWYELREIIGNLWWHHPAIDNDQKRAYYQAHQKFVRELNCKDHSCASCSDCESYMNDMAEGREHLCVRK